jgi:hypothetical protein
MAISYLYILDETACTNPQQGQIPQNPRYPQPRILTILTFLSFLSVLLVGQSHSICFVEEPPGVNLCQCVVYPRG